MPSIVRRRCVRRSGRQCVALVAIAAVWLYAPDVTSQRNPVTVEDAIEMRRIQFIPAQFEEVGYFSPDGNRFVSVVWKGDLERNVNQYSLMLFDLRHQKVPPRTLLTWELTSERNQHASPFSRLSFLPDNRTVVFLGAKRGEVPQVHSLDVETGQLRRLTGHPSAMLSYALAPRGQVRVFSATAQPDGSECRSLYRGGFSLFDRRLDQDRVFIVPRSGGFAELAELGPVIDALTGRRCEASGWSFDPTAKFFFVPESGGAPVPLLDETDEGAAMPRSALSASLRDRLVVSPIGTHALLFPWRQADVSLARRYKAFERRRPEMNAGSIAVIDLKTKQARPLSAAPVDIAGQSRIVWSRDGLSVITRSLLPLDASSDVENQRRASVPSQLAEIDVRTGRVSPIESAPDAAPLMIDPDGYLVVRDRNRLLRVRKEDGRWSEPSLLANLENIGLNPKYGFSTNGRIVAGVRDGLTTAPEMATYDPKSKTLNVLTDLNPALKQRAFGAVEKVFWSGPHDSQSFGYLIKPVDFVEGRRYPLVILLKDEPSDSSDDSFLIDGQQQLGGHAAQTLAGAGFVVLFTPDPPSLAAVIETPDEGPRMMAHVESAIDYLDGRRLIDRTRVGIGGWSRAAFLTDYVVMHSRYPFKAAIAIDGGGNYEGFMNQICGIEVPRDGACSRNFDKLTAARLSQQHNARGVISETSLITKLKNLGKAVDFYFYLNEPHNLKLPESRRHSLTVNVDWYRFWLQDYEDPDPAKRVQYERWRDLRKLQPTGTPQ